jgi:hypothetical protein
MRRFLTLLVMVAAFSLLTGPALGAADGTYRGRTSQGLKTYVKVREGEIKAVNVPWVAWARNCRPYDHRMAYGYPKLFRYVADASDPIERSGNRFSDSSASSYRSRGWTIRLRSRLSGRIAGNRITGTHDVRLRIRNKWGRFRCSRHVRWSATR